MTFNTIQPILDRLQAAGDLVRFAPIFDPDESGVREVLLTRVLNDWLYQKDRSKPLDHKEKIRAHLGRFVKGKYVDNKDFMKCWKDGIYEFRVAFSKRKDSIRIFGGFVWPDTVVCAHKEFRYLLDGNWDKAIDKTLRRLEQLLPGIPVLPCRPFFGCVTSNAFDVHTGEVN